MLVGFMDDFIKIKIKDNQGLKPYQKIIFQLGIALISGFFAYRNGLTYFYIPFSKNTINLGFWTIPFVSLIFIAITNSVNLTDGLDSLASSVSIVYLTFLSIIIYLQARATGFNSFVNSENQGIILLSICFVGGLIGFLVFNVNKASVFMGDTGSLALGGLVGSVSVFSANSLFIPLLGITFVASSVSVIIQVIVYKLKKKRVFLMAPLHHHFQLKGYSESKISYIYSLVTGIIGALLIISYL
jgi:phospho-N-acetylmuramoyl-pentapeptide-transferase